MSDMLVHWAIFEDTARLAAADARIGDELAGVLCEQVTVARLGALTRGGGTWVPDIVKKARTKWGGGDAKLPARLAFALGGVTHWAADVVMKPVMSKLANEERNRPHVEMQVDPAARAKRGGASIREVSAYFDAHVFRKVYLGGDVEPFNRFMLSHNETDAGRAAEQFVRALFQRALLSCHTLDPGKPLSDYEPWLDKLIDTVQPLYLDLRQYADVYASPDPRKQEVYGVETTFYVEADPAVAAARQLQQGGAVAQAEIDAALADGANAGHYGRALAMSVNGLRGVAAYWRGEAEDCPAFHQ